jgi:hypothetical protein
MRGISRRWSLPGILAVSTVLAGGLVAPLAHATTTNIRYAKPLGKGTACSVKLPCSIETAINDAPGNAPSEIRLFSGSYGSSAHPLTTELATNGEQSDVHGLNALTPPVIYEAASDDGLSVSGGDTVSLVTLVYSGPGYGLVMQGGTVSRVSVSSSSNGSTACEVLGTLVTTLCTATGSGGNGVYLPLPDIGSSLSFTSSLDGVTAVARGAGSIGILVASGTGNTYDVSATNTIAEGSANGVEVEAQDGAVAKLTASHSDLVNAAAPLGSGASLVTDATDQTTTPHFINAAAGDFHELRGSRTVDHGAPEPAGAHDLAGNPRTVGRAPDIGAYELLERPAVTTPQLVKVTARAARIGCRVWARQAPTTVQAIARHGKSVVRSAVVTMSDLSTPTTTDVGIRGLTPNTSYFVTVVATNAAGSTTSAARRVMTKG